MLEKSRWGLTALITLAVVASGLGTAVLAPGALPMGTAHPGGGVDGLVSASGPGGSSAASVAPTAKTQVYAVEFETSTLPAGATWRVTIGKFLENSTNGTLYYSEPNGSYSFTVSIVSPASDVRCPSVLTSALVPCYAITSSVDPVVVHGKNPLPVQVTFSYLYDVTFNETGLPAGTSWEVETSTYDCTVPAGSTCLILQPNGTYVFTVLPPTNYAAQPSSGTFNVSGAAPPTITISFTLNRYVVTFVESGLPNGTVWSVSLPSLPALSAVAPANLTAELGNGSYIYSAASANRSYETPGGSFVVAGAPLAVAVEFATGANVTFAEFGLPAGTRWWLNISGQPSLNTTGSTIGIWLPNGNYTFTAQPANKNYLPLRGSFSVQGGPVSLDLFFSPLLFAVTFTASGLPSSTRWWVNITGVVSASSTAKTITLYLTNGTYSYAIGSANRKYMAPAGSFSVNGGPASVAVTFHLVTYQVLFVETGLGKSIQWWVNISGQVPLSSTSAELNATLPNGTYTYTVASANLAYAALGGLFRVSGGGGPISITFFQGVIFSETGLPSGDTWSVTLNGSTVTSTTSPIDFTPETVGGSYLPFLVTTSASLGVNVSSGFVWLGSAAVTVPVTIGAPHIVTFGGEASGWSWSIWVGESTDSVNAEVTSESGVGALYAIEPNGNIQYSPGIETGTYDGYACDIFPTYYDEVVTAKVSGDTSVTVSYPAPSSTTCPAPGGGGGGCLPSFSLMIICETPGKTGSPIPSVAKVAMTPTSEMTLVLVAAIAVPGLLRGRKTAPRRPGGESGP